MILLSRCILIIQQLVIVVLIIFLNKNEFFVHKYLDSCEKYSNFAIEIDDMYCFFALLVTIMLIRTKKYITNVISLVYYDRI